MISNTTLVVVVCKGFVASNVHIPASFSSSDVMVSFPSPSKKRGSSAKTFSPDGFFHVTSGFGIPETFQVRVTGKPAVGFLEGSFGSSVNFGESSRKKQWLSVNSNK